MALQHTAMRLLFEKPPSGDVSFCVCMKRTADGPTKQQGSLDVKQGLKYVQEWEVL